MAKKAADQNTTQNPAQDQTQQNPQQELLLAKLSETAGLLESEKAQRQKLEERLAALESSKAEAEEDTSFQSLVEKLSSDEGNGPVNKAKNKTTDVDSMTPRQLLEVMAEVMDTAVGGQLAQLEERISKKVDASQDGFLKKLDGTQQILGKVIGHLGIAEAKSKYPDWDDVAEDVRKQMKEIPSLDLHRAYLLVKAQRNEDGIPADIVDSERPGRATTRATMPDGIPGIRSRKQRDAESEGEEGTQQRTRVRSTDIGEFKKRVQDAIELSISRRRQ